MRVKPTKPSATPKISAQKIASAHKKAPLDYISPWQAQHHQIYLAQSQNSESLQPKIKNIGEGRQNVVNSFLEKIRKTHSIHRKSRMGKNYSLEERQNTAAVTAGGFGITGTNNISGEGKITRNQSAMYSESFPVAQQKQKQVKSPAKNINDVKDLGFGLLQYAKANGKSFEMEKASIKNQSQQYQFENCINSLDVSKIEHRPSKRTMASTSHKYQRNRAFTEQQICNPTQVVFIKKKKNNKNMTVVDINQTAQQFYEQQIRYVEMKMLQKYRKLASSNKGFAQAKEWRRCQTQGGCRNSRRLNRKDERSISKADFAIGRQYTTDRKMLSLINRDEIKKKYCFMDQVKDESVVDKMRNIIRNHPSLAHTLLIAK